MRRLLLAATVLISASTVINGVAKAEKAALFQCVQDYKSLGVSADAALKECQKGSLADCVKRLLTGNYVATSIKSGSKGYLIDLGNEESRWMQGGEWRDKGCQPNQEGSSFSSDSRNWKWEQVREFFRQGWCSSESIELDQPITTEEAKLQCELQSFSPVRKDINLIGFRF